MKENKQISDIKCDKCGKQHVRYSSDIFNVTIRRHYTNNVIRMYLCEDCVDKLINGNLTMEVSKE